MDVINAQIAALLEAGWTFDYRNEGLVKEFKFLEYAEALVG